MSAATMPSTSDQKTPLSVLFGLLPLSIFLTLLAGYAQPGMRQRVEPIEVDVPTTRLALPEYFRRLVQPPERLINVPEKSPFLAGEEKCLLTLHGICALIRHVEGIRTQVAVRRLRGGGEGLGVVAELLEHAAALLEQSLLEVGQLLLGHGLVLFHAHGWSHC